MDVIIIFHFEFFALLPPRAQKIKIQKNEKNAWSYCYFTHVYQRLWLDNEIWCMMDRWTDGLKNGQMNGQRDRWMDGKKDI